MKGFICYQEQKVMVLRCLGGKYWVIGVCCWLLAVGKLLYKKTLRSRQGLRLLSTVYSLIVMRLTVRNFNLL